MKIHLLTTLLLVTSTTVAMAQGDAAAGQAKAAACAACHGADGNSSNPEWPKIAGQHASYLTKQLADYKAGEGRSNPLMMGMVAGLSDQDIADLAAWFSAQTLAGGTADPQLIGQGERLYRGGNAETGVPACIGCHGPAGTGDPYGAIPALAGQHAPYTVTQLQSFHGGTRANDANAMMRGTVRRMTAEEMRAVAAYIQGLH
jgi:cytochrome c553